MFKLKKVILSLAAVFVVAGSGAMAINAASSTIEPRIPNEPWSLSIYPGETDSDSPIGRYYPTIRYINCSSYSSSPFKAAIRVSGGATLVNESYIDGTGDYAVRLTENAGVGYSQAVLYVSSAEARMTASGKLNY